MVLVKRKDIYRDISIYIPSHKRSHLLETPKHLSKNALKSTKVVVHVNQLENYEKLSYNLCPVKSEGISAVRGNIIRYCPTRYCLMLDDDLKFYYRPKSGDWHLKYLQNPKHFDNTIEYLMRHVRKYQFAHTSISVREGANRILSDWEYNKRYTRFFLFDIKQLFKVKLGRIEVMEDFDIALQLLRMGKPSAISYMFAQGQVRGSNAPGGCSTYRTMKVQKHCAEKLARLHPGFVKTLKKRTKTAWNGMERTDATIYWKKAFESSGDTIEEYLDEYDEQINTEKINQ